MAKGAFEVRYHMILQFDTHSITIWKNKSKMQSEIRQCNAYPTQKKKNASLKYSSTTRRCCGIFQSSSDVVHQDKKPAPRLKRHCKAKKKKRTYDTLRLIPPCPTNEFANIYKAAVIRQADPNRHLSAVSREHLNSSSRIH